MLNQNLTNVPVVYDYSLVALSVVVAFISCLTALYMVKYVHTKRTKSYWWSAAGITLGLGIWTTHFIGLSAMQFPVDTSYDVFWTIVSIIPTISGSLIAFYASTGKHPPELRIPIAGISMGSGILLMHHIGMKGMVIELLVQNDPLILITSYVVTIAITMVTMHLFTKSLENPPQRKDFKLLLLHGTLLSLSIAGAHYIGMSASSYSSLSTQLYPIEELHHGNHKDISSIIIWVISGVIGLLFCIITAVVIYASRMKIVYEKQNSVLDNVVQERTKELADAIKVNDEQMYRLAQINVRMSILNESVNNLKQADNIYQRYEDTHRFYTDIVNTIIEATQSHYGELYISKRERSFYKIVSPFRKNIDENDIHNIIKDLIKKEIPRLKNTILKKTISTEEPDITAPDSDLPIREILIHPLAFDQSIKGLLVLAGHKFTTDDELLLSLYANEVSQTLQKNHLLATLKKKNLDLNTEKQEQRQLINKLKQAREQLLQSEKMASIGQLAAGVAHEINNPVGYINSNISSLGNYIDDIFKIIDIYNECESIISQDDNLYQRVQDTKNEIDLDFIRNDIKGLLKESTEGVTRVKQIVQDLKEFSHVDEAEWQWADIHKNIDSTLNIVNNEIKYKAEVIKDYGNLPEVECLTSQLNQVFLNLLINAAHAIEEKGTITIKTRTHKDMAYIDIIDTGKGIEPDKIGKIFDPFFTTKPVGEGTGLGLSLSYGIIQKHKGELKVESTPGEGTKFTIVIPLTHSTQRLAS